MAQLSSFVWFTSFGERPFPARMMGKPANELNLEDAMFGFFKAAKTSIVAAKTAQQELTVAFDAIGVDFMALHPVIHGAILKEAMVRGTEAASAQFIVFSTALDEGSGTDDQKANVLREIYRARSDGPYTPTK
jgi:hypothetical protein